jgi:signal transduction histidine kinase
MIVLRALFQARTWREFGYVLTGVFVAAPTFVLAMLGIVSSALSLLTVGLPLLVGILALARFTGRYFRGPARAWLGWEWPAPPPLAARGLPRRVRAVLTDPAGWRALAYCFVKFPLNLVAVYGGLIALVLGPAALTAPLWRLSSARLRELWDLQTPGDAWWLSLQGMAVLLVLPWFLRLFVALDRMLAYALLAPTRESLRIAELEAGRAALQQDAAALLRRVERDLHDGTQARLVSLGVTLSRIEHRTTDPALLELIAAARGTVTDALTELRDVVRGMHPPALDDGLQVALSTLAARSAVPAEVTVALAARPPDATASAVYFAVAELLTNVARHAAATRVRIDLRTEDDQLRLAVTDNGKGGASVAPGPAAGTGLAGLRRRAAALDGTLAVDSPAGGPTTVTIILPGEG